MSANQLILNCLGTTFEVMLTVKLSYSSFINSQLII
jgi:hypothetical protein